VAPDAYERLGTYVQMNPPVRDAHHVRGVWHGVEQGIADILGSDHAPHTRERRTRPIRTPRRHDGVQTLVPIMLDHVNAGRLPLERFVDMTSAGPQRLFGIARKGGSPPATTRTSP
jgi:dihydroorotase